MLRMEGLSIEKEDIVKNLKNCRKRQIGEDFKVPIHAAYMENMEHFSSIRITENIRQ